MGLLIKNGMIIDPATRAEKKADIFIEEEKVTKIVDKFQGIADSVIDASHCYVMPGFVDLHVHLREPGFEYKETIKTGSEAAARGGYTTVCAMPNTKPMVDNGDRVDYVHNKAKSTVDINILQIGAITKGQMGNELAEIENMVQRGIPAISEDGKSVMDAGLYLQGMKIAQKCKIPVFAHCEDKTIAGEGVINAGEKAEQLGVEGILSSAEDSIVARDIVLAREAGVHLHLCHCSTSGSVSLVRLAKENGVKVSAEVCPHHFTLTEEDIVDGDANYKMNPPLRTKKDVEALKKGLQEDVLDVIATDHAPHQYEEKKVPLTKAAFGVVGLETAASLTFTELVDKEYLTMMQMAEKMSYNPAKIIGIDKGTIQEGKTADIVIFNPQKEYTIDINSFASKGKNSPFQGRKVKGRVVATICAGKVVFRQEEQ